MIVGPRIVAAARGAAVADLHEEIDARHRLAAGDQDRDLLPRHVGREKVLARVTTAAVARPAAAQRSRQARHATAEFVKS